ncbi:MAG: hypothetical protein AABX08_03275 [Nanoarchaeota archaeon]
MSKSTTISFTVPHDIKLKLDAVAHIGHYDSLSEFLRDAIRTMLNNNRHLRTSLAYYLFKQNKIPIGKAAEIIGDPIDETKILFEHM